MNCMVLMSDSSFQPITREALAAQAAAIAARQAAESGMPAPVQEETPIAQTPLEVAPPVVVPPIVVPIVKALPVEEPVVVPEPVPTFSEVEKDLANVELDEDGNPQFKVSNALTGEFTASNLIVELPQDITAGGAPGIPGGAHRGINPYWYVAMISAAALLIAGGIALSFYSGYFN